MSFGFKKLVIYSLLLIFLSFSFCTCFDPPEVIGEPAYTNVEYSEDGKSITIYLDGSAPVPANRALTKELAMLGHDFFEVVFYYNDGGGSPIIARGSWELGEPAGIMGVWRTAAGVNYYGANPVGIPAAGQGSAVLFVGRKAFKTLLAVGTLSKIDETDITPGANNLITTATKKVSFDVNALKAGVNKAYSQSSFQVSASQSSTLEEIDFNGTSFPYFALDRPHNSMAPHNTYSATYTIDVHSKKALNDTIDVSYAYYAPAIIYSGGADCENIKPKHTLPGYGEQVSKYPWASGVNFNITSPIEPGLTFSGTVGFSILTTGENEAVCALTFDVPVHAVTGTADSSGNAPVQWHIRPGYAQYSKELDSGMGKNGGAVLIVLGDIEGFQTGITKVGDPKKFNKIDYPNNLYFSLKGFEIWYTPSSGDPVCLTPMETSPYPSFIGWTDLYFYYNDGVTPYPGAPLTATTELPDGEVLIRVEYRGAGGPPWLYTEFVVEVNYAITANVDIPYENRIFVGKPTDYTQIGNRITSPGNYLIVFSDNINLPVTVINNLNAVVNIYIVTTVEGITVGRDSLAQTQFLGNGNVTVYLGKWPFDEPAFVGGNIIPAGDRSFKVNSTGTWQQYGTSSPSVATSMFYHPHGTDGAGTGTLNFPDLTGVTVHGSSLWGN